MILVTGGTGFVGQEVVHALAGQRVRVLARRPEAATRLFERQPGVEVVAGDVLKPETLPAAMSGVTAVIHLVGFIVETQRITYELGHVEATRHVLAAARAAGVTRWVQMSAAGTRPHARSRYHRTKWQAEELVRTSGLDWTILRPSLIYGYDERDRLLNLLRLALSAPLDLLQAYSLALIDGGAPLIQPVSVREVARCFALAPVKREAIGRTLDLVGPHAMPWYELVNTVLAARGRPRAVREDVPLLLIVRLKLWGIIVLLPLVTAALFFFGQIGWIVVALLAAIWLALVALAARWRRTILWNLPGELLISGAELASVALPRALRPSEVLKMSVEDNIGDPAPAAALFGYTPEPFAEGVRRIVPS
jgi:NADH dehydrogenase